MSDVYGNSFSDTMKKFQVGSQDQTPFRDNTYQMPQAQFQKKVDNQVPCFGISAKPQKINTKQLQYQRKIALLKLQVSLLSIVQIIQPKVSNIKQKCFKIVLNNKNVQHAQYCRQKQQIQCVDRFVKILHNFAQSWKLKNLQKSILNMQYKNMVLRHIKNAMLQRKRSQQKRESQILRLDSKINQQNSLMFRNSQYNSQHAKKKNKQLKKKKTKLTKDKHSFCVQMDDLLSEHEQYLSKRK